MSRRVSVLIPVWNYDRFLGCALESVRAQSFKDIEIIIVDDGSTDETAAVAAGFPEARYVYQEHKGVAAARNRALREARGGVIAFLDADDMWTPDKLEKQVACLDAHPEWELVFSRVKNFYDAPDAPAAREKAVLETEVKYCLPSACIRAEAFEKYGGFDEARPYGEDTGWVVRLLAAGADMSRCVEEELYLRRVHPSGVTVSHGDARGRKRLELIAAAARRGKKLR